MRSGLRQMYCAAGPDSLTAGKPWRLSASVVVLAPRGLVPENRELGNTASGEARQDYKVCLLRRGARSSFMPDVMVFPGGAVDAEDGASACQLLNAQADDLDAVVRCAAIREVFEESGIGILEPLSAASRLQAAPHGGRSAWRQAIHKDPSQLTALCAAAGATPATSPLLPWCSFVTPDMEHQRLKKGGFDARFFVWPSPPEAAEQLAEALADGQETTGLIWLSPDEALAAQAAGRVAMAPPQWYILRELADNCPFLAGVAAYASGASRALVRDYPIKPYPTQLEESEIAEFWAKKSPGAEVAKAPVMALAYPGDEKHPVFPGPPGARHRMLLSGEITSGAGRYELQRSEVSSIPLPLKEVMQDWRRLAKL
ncbi:unnamed protein product [Polarella glacialis]|uniref:Nudix hydrolase domain-containing protein n=1 Tax=Polarella glacialis TaxID=89957 RepID=A0A813DM92_POLGL|nr:unnamed protein product [Polarella glacialis]